MGTTVINKFKCPHCGQTITKSARGGDAGEAKERLIEFGPLFMTCPACGKPFRNPNAVELAVMDPPEGYLKKWRVSTFVFIGIFAALGLFVLINGQEAAANPAGMVLFCLIICGILLFVDVNRYNKHTKTIEEEYAKSVERIQNDPLYALILKQAGFNVPDELMPKPKESSVDDDQKESE